MVLAVGLVETGPTAHPATAAPAVLQPKRQLDLAYAARSPAQRVDVYWPPGVTGPLPLVIAIHGGGFAFGDKRAPGPMMAALRFGYAVAAINYRLSDEAPFPAAVEDVKAAIRYLRANAAELQLDPTRFAVWGASAGGYLAAMAAATSGQAVFDNPDLGNSEASSAVQAAIDWFGPTDFAAIAVAAATPGAPTAVTAALIARFLGAPIEAVPDTVRAATPGTYVAPTIPPILIEHGDRDTKVPPAQSREFASLIARTAGPSRVDLVLVAGGGHGGAAFRSAENLQRVFRFLDEALRRP
jgi:acetyl esterase/lipase